MARPTKATDKVKSELLRRIAEGESVKRICEDEHMPSRSVIYAALTNDTEFQDKYARAMEIRADNMFDESLEIADGVTLTSEAIQKAKLRIDTRKWHLARMMPKKYGEKIETVNTHQGPEGGPVTYREIEWVPVRAVDGRPDR